jgi:cytochrome c peroxidase
MMTGVRATAEAAVRAGIRHIQFVVRPEEDAEAVDAYLKSMKPVRSPYAATDAAKRGEAVFKKAECATCHTKPHGTDMTMHDVGTGEGRDEGKQFDTPTLTEAWRTAPYLYDGRAATLEGILAEHNAKQRHGSTADLTDEERADLVAYLLSL